MKRALLVIGLLAACGGNAASVGPPKVDIPVVTPTAQGSAKRETPPASLASKEATFPKAERSTLPNGVELALVRAGSLPIAQVRVLVHAGQNYAAPGTADITAQMLKDGGTKSMTSAQLLQKLETLGADLGVSVDFDATVFSVAVVKDKLSEALAIVGEMIAQPRFDEAELKKLKTRMSDEAEDAARTSGQFMAMRVAYRELFADKSPYATYGLLPSEIAKVSPAAVRDFHKRFYVGKNTEVVLVGDVDATSAELVKKHFGGLPAGEAPKIELPAQNPPAKQRVVLVDRPKSVQSEVFVFGFAPPRSTPDWADLRVVMQILGGGVAGRLFLDVREQRSLAYATSGRITELARGPQPYYVYAGTKTPSTAAAAQGLIENLQKMAQGNTLSEAESQSARRYLSDIFAVRVETIGSIADLLASQEALGLGDGYWDKYREAVRTVTTPQAEVAAKKLFGGDKFLVVVAGDAAAIEKEMRAFGDLVVIDPAKDFTVKSGSAK